MCLGVNETSPKKIGPTIDSVIENSGKHQL